MRIAGALWAAVSSCLLVACSQHIDNVADVGPGPDAGAGAADAAGLDASAQDAACADLCELSLLAGTPGGQGAVDGVAGQARMRAIGGAAAEGVEVFLTDTSGGAIRQLDLLSFA